MALPETLDLKDVAPVVRVWGGLTAEALRHFHRQCQPEQGTGYTHDRAFVRDCVSGIGRKHSLRCARRGCSSFARSNTLLRARAVPSRRASSASRSVLSSVSWCPASSMTARASCGTSNRRHGQGRQCGGAGHEVRRDSADMAIPFLVCVNAPAQAECRSVFL